MNIRLSTCCLLICTATGFAQQPSADDIMAFVRNHLPSEPIKLKGTLKVRTERGFTKTSLPVEMDLDWGAAEPRATYRIGETGGKRFQSLDITWRDGQPIYAFSAPKTTLESEILDTGVDWSDLSFSFLWWKHPVLVGEESKISRECRVVDIPVPSSTNRMRLWIEKKMGMLLEARLLDAVGDTLRRLQIRSIKKIDGMWLAKDLEITNKGSDDTTTLQITDLQREHHEGDAAALDPAEPVNLFTFDLYGRIAKRQKGNLFLSPYSVSSALAMAYGGARGETAAQMEQTLHFGGQDETRSAFAYLRTTLADIQQKGNVELNTANSLWPQRDHPLLSEYLALTKESYGSEIKPVDFKADAEGARQKINAWVEQQTRDKIKDLIPKGMLNPSTRLVLANAIYFKGKWAARFDPANTRPAPFKCADGTSVEVPTMSQTDDFQLAHGKGFQALELPYEDGLSMLVFLPDQPDGLPALEASLSAEALSDLEFHKQETQVQMPRFKLELEFDLGKMLAEMGMPLAFSDHADFSGIDGAHDLFIGAVAHKAFVEVNEEGTEAAAATAVVMRATSMPSSFVADHPFLFLIRENGTSTVLFIGRVADPS